METRWTTCNVLSKRGYSLQMSGKMLNKYNSYTNYEVGTYISSLSLVTWEKSNLMFLKHGPRTTWWSAAELNEVHVFVSSASSFTASVNPQLSKPLYSLFNANCPGLFKFYRLFYILTLHTYDAKTSKRWRGDVKKYKDNSIFWVNGLWFFLY